MNSLLVIATGNQHKVDEMSKMLVPAFTCIAMQQLGDCPSPKETGATFEANATLKVEQLAAWLNQAPPLKLPLDRFDRVDLLADDSGLEVDALDGAPGVHSARFAASDPHSGNASDAANNAKLLDLLKPIPEEQRSARFRCVLALLPYRPSTEARVALFAGVCEGQIADEYHGSDGFGYDPLFFPQGFDRSFGELGIAVKNQISHRALALRRLTTHLKEPR
tara:strand:- start:722 stop:1384 length:663 start_codon:yes stop_codon:yes gene_type:complete